MLKIEDLETKHLRDVLLLWQFNMGSRIDGVHADKLVQSWFNELKCGGPFRPRALKSKWVDSCDVCLAINGCGELYAVCCEAALSIPGFDDELYSAAREFEKAVSTLQ